MDREDEILDRLNNLEESVNLIIKGMPQSWKNRTNISGRVESIIGLYEHLKEYADSEEFHDNSKRILYNLITRHNPNVTYEEIESKYDEMLR